VSIRELLWKIRLINADYFMELANIIMNLGVAKIKKQNVRINFERLKRTIIKSSQIGTIPGDGLCRLALTEEDKVMRDILMEWMDEAGLKVKIDDYGNMYGRREGLTDLPPVLLGSHLDTQPNGGRFDGIIGVLAALEIIRTLNDNNIETLRPIEIVNFTNEEGARFEPPLLGSGGATGVFDKDFIYSRKDREGKTFEEELSKIGYKGKMSNRVKDVHAFIELHIEQGPVLENEQISIGAVEGIQGMTWLELKVTGESGHAGPTPMSLRCDALMAVSKLIVHIEKKAKCSDADTSVTVGRMSISPNVVNSIPKEVIFSLDIRNKDDNVRELLIEDLRKELQEISKVEKVQLEIKDLWEVKASNFHPGLVNQVVSSAKECGYTVKRMVSGAGHDSKYINQLAPTCMIFVPSVGGRSHVETELTLDADIEKGANVLLLSILEVSNNKKVDELIKESLPSN
jgi:beta-ureidopropionase / N-carbamoyl-L-amino-acid hydrolase